jgi:hypothetical protein
VLVPNAGPCPPLAFSSQEQVQEFGTVIHEHLNGLVDCEESYVAGSSAIRSRTIVFVFEPNAADAAQQREINGIVANFSAWYPNLNLTIRCVS